MKKLEQEIENILTDLLEGWINSVNAKQKIMKIISREASKRISENESWRDVNLGGRVTFK
jgi:hypothetical protein